VTCSVLAATVAAVTLSLAGAACSSGSSVPASAASPGSNGAPLIVSRAPAGSAGPLAGRPSGPGCAGVPTRGAGSFAGMAADAVATAASDNPMLSDLAAALRKAKLFPALNAASALTVFAPDNAAFARIPRTRLAAIMASGLELTKILSYHVVIGRITPAQLTSGRTLHTLEGGTIKTAGPGRLDQVNTAHVVCGNVQTANATVYIISSVLTP
jgi:uncharacterized surface protein with fasciclin (FAS1) repeats